MLKIFLKQISPSNISNHSTEMKDNEPKDASSHIILDNKENIDIRNKSTSALLQLDLKAKQSQSKIKADLLEKSNELLHQKRRRLKKVTKAKSNKAIDLSLNDDSTESKEVIFSSLKIVINEKYQDCFEDYTDEEYNFDLENILKDKRHLFMYNNFPSSYNKEPFFYHIKNSKKNHPIMPRLKLLNSFQKYNEDLTELPFGFCPIKKWSPPQSINIDFLKQLESKWDYSIADFSIELILEFVMKNNYNWSFCLSNIDQCFQYVRSFEEKANKRYRLRNHKVTKFNHGAFNNDHFEYFY